MTWEEIKIATLQKMFATDGNAIGNDSATLNYVAAMPHVANEALQLLATSGKFILKKFEIAHTPIDNLLSESISYPVHKLVSGSEEFTYSGAKSYYFGILRKRHIKNLCRFCFGRNHYLNKPYKIYRIQRLDIKHRQRSET